MRMHVVSARSFLEWSRGQRSMWAHVKDIWLLGWGSDSWGQVLQGCLKKMWHGFSQRLLHMQSLKFQSHFTLGTRKVVNLCVCMFECIIIHWKSKFTNWFLSLTTSGTVLSRTGKVWPVRAIQSLNVVFHNVAFPAACTSPLDKLHAWWWRVSHR